MAAREFPPRAAMADSLDEFDPFAKDQKTDEDGGSTTCGEDLVESLQGDETDLDVEIDEEYCLNITFVCVKICRMCLHSALAFRALHFNHLLRRLNRLLCCCVKQDVLIVCLSLCRCFVVCSVVVTATFFCRLAKAPLN